MQYLYGYMFLALENEILANSNFYHNSSGIWHDKLELD